MTIQRVDDLAPLFAGGEAEVGFRQGVVTAWDQTTGMNTVNIGGTLVDDLPVLTVNDVSIIAVGDVVGLLRFQSTFFILGRVQPAAPPDSSRSTLDFESNTQQVSNFAITTTIDAKASITLHPPSWVDEAAVMVGQVGQGVNFGATTQDYLVLSPAINGSALAGQVGGAGNGGGSGFASTVGTKVITGPFGGSILVEGRVFSQFSNWGAANASNSTSLSVLALYRRIS